MNTFAWQIRQWARRLGIAGLAGLGLLIAALLLKVFAVGAAEQAVAAQQTRIGELRLAAQARATEPAPPADPLALLPPAGTASQQIGELEKLAQAHDLELPRGQYSVAPVTGATLARWQLVLPVEGPYPALHAFLAAALERMPNLALDELKLKRERIDATELQAELRLSLFVETAP